MMDEYVKRADAVQCALDVATDLENDGFIEEGGAAHTVGDWLDGLPAADVVARDCYNRVLAENDAMRAQLAQIGKKPGDDMSDVRLVVRGQWQETGDFSDEPIYWVKCDKCGVSSPDYDYEFCPNCGADMR